jgi:hypothetical protein
MMQRFFPLITAAMIFLAGPGMTAFAQDEGGRIVFTDPKSTKDKPVSEEDLRPRVHAWGIDAMIGTDGFGIGGFYQRNLSDKVTLFSSLTFSEAKDPRQKDFYTYWGEQVAVNKINRVYRLPLLFGIQYRLFEDDIADNFRPYVNTGAGPVFLLITPWSTDFFSDFGKGYFKLTYGGFVGVGANFGFDRSNVLGLNVRYYIIPLPSGIQSVQQGTMSDANGFFIALSFGSAF